MEKVLIFSQFYYPAYKAGGPVRSVFNIVQNLSKDVKFYVATGDRDHGETMPFKDVEQLTWCESKNANVYYAPAKWFNIFNVNKLISDINPDVVYINSFFNFHFSIIPLIVLNLFKLKCRVVIAPRGELSKGALRLKKTKKRIFIMLFKMFLNLKRIKWHATSIEEKDDVKSIFSNNTNIKLLSNMVFLDDKHLNFNGFKKEPENLNIIYLSRITPKKNLLFCLDVLNEIDKDINVNFDIFGLVDDNKYYSLIESKINSLSPNIVVNFHEAISNEKVIMKMQEYHLFFLPTLSENFGHAILEAMFAGLPILISDQTPWRNLENSGVGWDISLENRDKFVNAIQFISNVNFNEMKDWKVKVHDYAKSWIEKKMDFNSYYELFGIDE